MSTERPYGYIVLSADLSAIEIKGGADTLDFIVDYPPERVRTFDTHEDMERDPLVAGTAHVASVNRLRDQNDALKTDAAYASKRTQAERWLALHPIEVAGVIPSDPEFGFLIDECHIEAVNGVPASPWDCANAIIAASDASTRAIEKARRLENKRLAQLAAQDGT